MPEKTTKAGKQYLVTKKFLIWTPEADEDEEIEDIKIPLRMKVKLIRSLAGQDTDDVETMFAIIGAIAPGQSDKIDEMEVSDFSEMFDTWDTEYKLLHGATLGE